jgi:hypothetical protein
MTLFLSIDLGQPANFITKPLSTTATNTRIVGILNGCQKSQNPPIYLSHTPTNNLFNVRVLNEINEISLIDNYVLTLNFEKIK